MAFYRIEYPAYADRPANSLLVNGEVSRDLHISQIANAGCTDFTVTELSREDYLAAVRAKMLGAGK